MNSSCQCQIYYKRRTWSEQSLYIGQLTGQRQGRKLIGKVNEFNAPRIKCISIKTQSLRTLDFFFFFFFLLFLFPFQLNSPSKDELDMFRCTVETLKKHRTKPDKTKNETQETR